MNKAILFGCFLITASILSGCSSNGGVRIINITDSESKSYHKVVMQKKGEIKTATVGDSVYRDVELIVTKGYVFTLTEPASINLENDDKLTLSRNQKSSAKTIFSQQGIFSNLFCTPRICLKDPIGVGSFSEWTFRNKLNWNPLTPAVKYTKEVVQSESIDYPEHSYKIIYKGKSKNLAKFTVQEFANNMIREAYSQNFDFELNSSNQGLFAFKKIKIKILDASSVNITYEILSTMSGTEFIE